MTPEFNHKADPFYAALEQGSVEELRSLYAPDSTHSKMRVYLSHAIDCNNPAAVEFLADQMHEVPPVTRKSIWDDMMLRAVRDRRSRLVDILAAAGASASNAECWRTAARHGDTETLQILLTHAGQLSRVCVHDALTAATETNRHGAVEWMFTRVPYMITPSLLVNVIETALKGRRDDMALSLAARLAEYAPTDQRRTAMGNLLSIAAMRGAEDIVELVCPDYDGEFEAPLRHACEGKSLSCLRLLCVAAEEKGLLRRADLNLMLMVSLSSGFDDGVRFVIDKGADVNSHGGSATQIALKHWQEGRPEMLMHLMDQGADFQHAQELIRRKVPEATALIDNLCIRAKIYANKAEETLRRGDVDGSLLHQAARAGIIRRFLREKPYPVSAFTEKDSEGDSVMEILLRRNHLSQLFDPVLWKGRRAEAEELIGHLPPHIRKNTDFFAAFLSKTDAETLRDKRQGQRFRL